MKVLLIDTCGELGSVALAETGEFPPRVVTIALPGRSASERLIGAVRELVSQGGAKLRDLDAIAVVHGPGSFTGVRVGVSAAKGLCEALGLPVVAISRLAVLAEAAREELGQKADREGASPIGPLVAALDAGRGEFYCGLYENGICLQEALRTRAELLELAARGPVVVSEPRVAEALRDLSPLLVDASTGEAALGIALRRIASGRFDDIGTLDANYLRRTDAEIFARQAAGAAR